LIIEHGWWSKNLNMDDGERFRALLAACWLALLLLAAAGLASIWPALILLVLIAVANRRLLSFFWRRRGMLFAIGGVLYHQLYYLYSAGAFAYCLAAHRWSAIRRRLDRRTHRPDRDGGGHAFIARSLRAHCATWRAGALPPPNARCGACRHRNAR
jgi:hypothetical protein